VTTDGGLPDLLVTGTDTGVGKTVIAAALVLARRDRGLRALGFKPVESGLSDEEAPDSAVLAAATAASDSLADPLLQLGEPLAPAVAADRAGRALDTNALERRIRDLRQAGFSLVVEGAGGLLVPLAWGYTVLDLASRSGLVAVIVARAGLGALNQTQLTAEALRARGVPLRAVVLNGRGDPPDLAESTNPAALERLLPGVPVVVVPRHDTRDPLEAARRSAPLVAGL
jgi:dethiobiotin synthetase